MAPNSAIVAATRRGVEIALVVGIALGAAPAQEPIVDAPLASEEAARTMVVPDGFRVTLFAGEPDVRQPIAFCIDDRARLWVAEAYGYPNHSSTPGKDRILILTDADGDGRHDRRDVFYDQLNYVSGIEVGFGGVWVMSPPYFYFFADRDGDDRPDGEPRVVLDGFGNHANAHNMANGFAWGPDGWLYGTHGRTNWSMIGRPGTPHAERTRFDGGVYRYHPLRDVWEPYADGTTNPWGIDWNDHGEAFISNCVDPHLFHVIPGAHYEPWRSRDSSRFAYERIPAIADHLHFLGGKDVRARLLTTAELDAGGGHAHCGTMVYLGDGWPERFRDTVFLNNVHGRRINNDVPRRQGSGYTAGHARDLMIATDPWFMGVTLAYGPDGSVFASDWSDTGECHSTRNTRRETGRIYKISYGEPRRSAANVDLASLDDAKLAELQIHRNDWFVRHARRLLHERSAAGRDMSAVHSRLHAMFVEQTAAPRKLRALWALHVTDGVDDTFLVEQLSNGSEYVRAWAARLLCEDAEPPRAALARFAALAASDDSPLVRLHLASLLQRLSIAERWPIATALASRAEDATDSNVPLMLWYGVEPLVHDDFERFAALARSARIPLLRRHITRRIASFEDPGPGLERLTDGIASSGAGDLAPSLDIDADIVAGMLDGLEGRRRVDMPPSWPLAYAKLSGAGRSSLRDDARRLALVFDDPAALRELRSCVTSRSSTPDERRGALRALIARKVEDLPPLLFELLDDAEVRGSALRGLAEYDHAGTPSEVLGRYSTFDPLAKQDALQTLASRPNWAKDLLGAIDATKVPRKDLSAYTARQIERLGDANVVAELRRVWGELRSTSDEKARRVANLKRRLSRGTLADADSAAGRRVFDKVCASCHRLFDAGAEIGPELTGAQRSNLDYVLENLIDPGASVAKDFQMQVVTTTGGRVITGIAIDERSTSLTLQTVNERIVVPSAEIASREGSTDSLMPEGLIETLSFTDLRDLVAYLASPRQIGGPGD